MASPRRQNSAMTASFKLSSITELVGHITNCINDRSTKSVYRALSWLQSISHGEGVIVCEIETGAAPKLVNSLNVSYSQEWIATYQNHDFEKVDPVLQRAVKSRGFFSWQEAMPDCETEAIRNFWEAAKGYGLIDGMAYTIDKIDGGSSNTVLLVSLSAPLCKLNSDVVFAWDSLMPAVSVALSSQPSAKPSPFTEREIEVLQWSAQGKTVWEISQILAVAEATTKFHLANIYRKLDVGNRAQAISRAAKEGWL